MKLSTLQKGLVLHAPLSEERYNPATKRVDDLTPYENHGTSANTPNFTTDRMGQADRAMSFNGTNDYVDCGNDESLDITDEVTISLWAKPPQEYIYTPFYRLLAGKTVDYTGGYNLSIDYRSGQNAFILVGNLGSDRVEFLIPEFNRWYHVVGTIKTSTSEMKLYIDGVLEDANTGIIGTNAENFKIGGGISSRYTHNSLADVRIHNRALFQQEITALYEQYRPKLSLGSLQKGLVLDMPLTSKRYNAGNTKFDDLTPYENRGVNTGGDVDTDHTTFVAVNSDNVRIPDSASLSPTSAMTAMVWVKGEAQSAKYIFSHRDDGASQTSFSIGTHENRFKSTISDNGSYTSGHRKSYYSVLTTMDETWHLIGFTFDAGTFKLFVDGFEDINVAKAYDDAITTIHDSTADVVVGCRLSLDSPTGLFDGDLAYARMYNRALTNAEWLLAFEKQKGAFL